MKSNEKMGVNKRPYVRPQLRVIKLLAEEVLGSGCKLPTAGGGAVTPPCAAAGCVGPGS